MIILVLTARFSGVLAPRAAPVTAGQSRSPHPSSLFGGTQVEPKG
jgi:hypothetical protein